MTNVKFAQFSKASVLAIAGVLVGAVPSFSASTSVIVSGDSRPSDCGSDNSAAYSNELSGSLAGCWSTFVGHFNCQEMNGFALYTEIGREEFAGTLDGQDIEFDTQYTFSGVFPSGSCPEPDAKKEVVGGGIHYVSAEGLVGVIRSYDVMYGDAAPHYYYEGTLAK